MIRFGSWDRLRGRFPYEAGMRDRIIEYVKEHPGCTFGEIYGHLKPTDRQGLQATLFLIRDDGDIVSHGPHPVETYYPRGWKDGIAR